MSNHVLTVEGHRAPPTAFVKRLKRFDPNLRVVWGMGQGVPFPGWVIERKIPPQMKARVYADTDKKSPNRERYADQWVVDAHGNNVCRRAYDMMPDWHEVYRVMNEDGDPILELSDFVIAYLKRNYERTLLGYPALGLRHHMTDLAEREAREKKAQDELLDRSARKVMEHRYEIFHETDAFGGQPSKVFKERDDHATESVEKTRQTVS